jgi:alcohol dehydrogenase (cytochrome c)
MLSGRRLGMAAVLVTASLVLAACGSAAAPGASEPAAPRPLASGSWLYPNGNLANTRDAAGAALSSKNVGDLRLAWTFKITGKAAAGVSGAGALAANPVVRDGVVYLQDLDSNVYALTLATGRLRWEYTLNKPMTSGPGPDGVAVTGSLVYGISPTTVFALNARTGHPVWVDRTLLRPGDGSFEIQPQVAGGRVYLASAYGTGAGGGVLMALSAATGRLLWRFNTLRVPDKSDQVVGAGGAWETPLVGTDGSVTYGIGNPYQNAADAIDHPAAQLYTDSDVNLSAATGKLRWYYQGVPNDFMDYDMQASPIAATINGQPAVLGGGKMGEVYAMNARTGRLIWKTPVGKHNGSITYGRLALEHKLHLKAPYTIWPGSIGGMLSNMAVAGNTVYVVTNDWRFTAAKLSTYLGTPEGQPAGEVEALNLTTGRVEWDTSVSSLPLGAATVAGNLVFTTLWTGVLLAFNRQTGALVYQHKLPTSDNAPLAIAGNTVIVPAGGPETVSGGIHKNGHPQVVAYTLGR